jgi:hypothetical protein
MKFIGLSRDDGDDVFPKIWVNFQYVLSILPWENGSRLNMPDGEHIDVREPPDFIAGKLDIDASLRR